MKTEKSIQFTTIDYLIIGSAMALILFSWIYAGIHYGNLPAEIPSHFNHKGEVDGYSEKNVLWGVSGLFTALTIGIFYLAKSSAVHNIQLKTKQANFRLVAIFMPFVGLIHALAVYSMINEAYGTFQYSEWVLPFILISAASFLILMFIIIGKNRKS